MGIGLQWQIGTFHSFNNTPRIHQIQVLWVTETSFLPIAYKMIRQSERTILVSVKTGSYSPVSHPPRSRCLSRTSGLSTRTSVRRPSWLGCSPARKRRLFQPSPHTASARRTPWGGEQRQHFLPRYRVLPPRTINKPQFDPNPVSG